MTLKCGDTNRDRVHEERGSELKQKLSTRLFQPSDLHSGGRSTAYITILWLDAE